MAEKQQETGCQEEDYDIRNETDEEISAYT